MMIRAVFILIVNLFCWQLIGCSTPHQLPDDPRYSPVAPNTLAPPQQTDGSLFNQGYGIDLWQDQRAKRAGDILTVFLSESTTSSKSSKSSLKKDYGITSPEPTLFGTTPSISALPFPSNSKLNLSNDASVERDFSGEIGADQSNALTGIITVTVADVLPNGVLVIRGEKWLSLTEGSEFIRLTGLVRPADIQPDNSIESNKIADARITYSGSGQFASAHKIGWLGKFFNSNYWPF